MIGSLCMVTGFYLVVNLFLILFDVLVVDFFNRINLIYGTVCDYCTGITFIFIS